MNIDALAAAVRSETKVVFIANPGNPTGTRVSRRELLALRTMLPHRILLVVDEAYGEFVDVGEESMFDLPTHTNTVILRSFSKAYGLAGMRVGWGMFPRSIAQQIRKVLNPNNVSVASQAAAEAAMRDQPHMRAACREIAQRRDHFATQIRRMGLGVTDSFTNFVLIRFPDPEAARQAEHTLRCNGVLMRGLAGYNLADCLRATIGSEEDMLFAGRLLQDWCSQEGISPRPLK